MTAYFVRTFRSVAVPGVEPLTFSDWLTIYGIVFGPLIILGIFLWLVARR